MRPYYWDNRQYNQPEQPVMGVRWYEAQAYCEWSGLRLPSEVEWEYACRAGTKTRFYSGDGEKDLDRVGWYEKNSEGRTHPVGQKEPNGFGLYDMHGNVWEWTRSRYASYPYKPDDGREDLRNVTDSDWLVVRGGSFYSDSSWARSARRGGLGPNDCSGYSGFRVVASPFRL